MTVTLYLARSKKNKLYFKFVQYADDGYGMYEATYDEKYFSDGDLPSFWSSIPDKNDFHAEFDRHTFDEVEFVKCELKVGA